MVSTSPALLKMDVSSLIKETEGRYTYNVSKKGRRGVPGLLMDANRGRGVLGHVNVSKKPPRLMRTNDVILAFQVSDVHSRVSSLFSIDQHVRNDH